MRPRFLALVYTLLLLFSIFAQDGETAGVSPSEAQSAAEDGLEVFLPVDGINQWQKAFDISNLDPGVYNVVVRARDIAGNVIEAEPVDIRIDPESDLPVASITYPGRDLRITGDLTVLGSARDDDQVQFVEVRLGDEAFRRADGADFWSQRIETDSLADGQYTVTTRATDVNGLQGREVSQRFFLDRDAPLISIDSHRNGDLVSGRFQIAGNTSDSNGVAAMEYSLDGGDSWLEARIPRSAREGQAAFIIPINSRDLLDGPQILLFRSTDLQGSTAETALLLYVDNSPPVIEIVYPREDEPENGYFMVAGRASDDTGVESLFWSYRGGELQEIQLPPGNPFWSIMVDFVGKDQMDLDFILSDVAGNQTELRLRRPLDVEADKPGVQLLSPVSEGDSEPRLAGWVSDDDAPEAVVYRLNRGEPQRIESDGSFSVDLEDLSPGDHQISIRAVDRYGFEGDEQQISFFIPPDEPQISFQSMAAGDGSTLAYRPGLEFRSDRHRILSGSVVFASGSGSVTVSLPGVDQREVRLTRGDEQGEYLFAIELGPRVPFGYLPVTIVASDALGTQIERTAYLWSRNLSRPLSDFGFYLADGARAQLSRGEAYQLRFIGHPLETIEVRGSDVLEAQVRNGLIEIRSAEPGVYENLSIYGVTDRGTEFEADLPTLVFDFAPPEFELSGDASGSYGRNPRISGSVDDDAGRPTVEYRINRGDFSPVTLREAEGRWSFDLPVDVAAAEGAPVLVQIRAMDSSGKGRSVYRSFAPTEDPENPPRPGVTVLLGTGGNGLLRSDQAGSGMYIAAAFRGVESVRNIRYSIPEVSEGSIQGFPVAEGFIPVPGEGSYTLSLTADYGEDSQLRGSARFTVVDGFPRISAVDLTAGAQIVRQENLSLNFRVPGTFALSRVEYSLNGGETLTARTSRGEGAGLFSIPVANLPFGLNRYSVNATDEFGRSHRVSGLFFLVADSQNRAINDNPGLYGLGSRDGRHEFYLNGRELASADFEQAPDGFELITDGQYISLNSTGGSRSGPLTITSTTIDGDVYRIGPAQYSADVSPPELRIVSDVAGEHFSSEVPIRVSLTDEDETVLEYRLDDGNWSAFPFDASGETAEGETDADDGDGDDAQDRPEAGESAGISPPTDGNFSGRIPIGARPDGPLTITLRARDASGNSSTRDVLVFRDASAPVITPILPEAGEAINGAISLMFRVDDNYARDIVGSFALGDGITNLQADNGFLRLDADFSPFSELPDNFVLSMLDEANNEGEIRPAIAFDPESDKPRVQVQLPVPNALITGDAVFSGTVLDDDGISRISWSLDGGEPRDLDGGNSFELTVPFADLADNEHLMEITAYDLQGVPSDPVRIPFRVSRQNPDAELTSPVLGSTNRAEITLEGRATDENGISRILVSFNNGLSYKEASLLPVVGDDAQNIGDEGEVEDFAEITPPEDPSVPEAERSWVYALDSQVLVDGTYMVLIRAVDGYGVESVATSLLTVDNTSPFVEVSLPRDGEDFTEELPLQMRLSDELSVSRVQYQISLLDEEGDGESTGLEGSLVPQPVVIEQLDITSLDPGLYNLTLYVYDDANNETIVSRDFIRRVSVDQSIPKILYPLDGAEIRGPFYLEGRVEGDRIPETVSLYRNGSAFAVSETDEQGYFRHQLASGDIPEGDQRFSVAIDLPGSERRISREIRVDYAESGPWVMMSSIRTGQFASQRPWIEGSAGYNLSVSQADSDGDGELSRAELRPFALEALEYSLDNGLVFREIRAEEQWRFRLETQEINDGQLSILVRARFANGETAQDTVYVFVDDTNPAVTILDPEEGLAFNGELMVSGTASDSNGLSDISVMLRPRSKNSYEVPQFIQGLYVDAHVLGATIWEVGLGLTFFDNNVKLQALFGQAPPGRFNGNVLGFKMLANVFSLPYGFLFGPDWDFLSSSIAVGAAFEYFTMENSPTPDQPGLVLGAIILQLELLKIELQNAGMFNAYAAYVENQLWFISSDVQGGLAYRMAFGLRINVF